MEEQNIYFYKIKKAITEKDFLRMIVVELGTNAETPADVFDGEFGKISCQNRQMFSLTGSVEIFCSASIGYDREVKKQFYNESFKRYETEYETETNWVPYQTTCLVKNVVGFAKNNEKNDLGDTHFFCNVLEDVPPEDRILITRSEFTDEILASKGGFVLKEKATAEAYVDMVRKAIESCKKTLPGDRFEDFHSTENVEIQHSDNYIIPYYNVTYKYSGDSHYMWACANGSPILHGTVPKGKDQERPNCWNKLLSVVSTILSIILVFCVAFESKNIALVAVLNTIIFVLYEWVAISYRISLNNSKVTKKKTSLISFLTANNLEKLSDQELKKFNFAYQQGVRREMNVQEAFPLVFYVSAMAWNILKYIPNLLAGIFMTFCFLVLPTWIFAKKFFKLVKRK